MIFLMYLRRKRHNMLENIKILTSRRAYEFRIDDIRLSALSTKQVQEQVQQLFQFQASMMGSPAPTFGDVPATYPPGFVFDMGAWISSEEQQLVPIRFLHFEQRRIVIDVAGSSSALTPIFERLRHFFSGLHAQDGSPVIGEPERVLDYSEITAKYPFSLDAVIAPPLRDLLNTTLNKGSKKEQKSRLMVPSFAVQFYLANQELAVGPVANDVRVLTFAQRAGTRPEECIYFSGAPLDSDTHLNYLNELEKALTS